MFTHCHEVIIIDGFKVKLLIAAALIILAIFCITLCFQHTEGEEESAIEFSLSQAQYANKSDHFHRHTVVSNGPECASIGMKMLREYYGTAVDAAIATLFCEGVLVCQSMGLGGGFFATIYHKANGTVDTLIARERAPIAAIENMFENTTTVAGVQSVAVPGELKGYAEMHKKYGRVPWKTLIQPTIDLCRSGHIVTEYLERVLLLKREFIIAEPSMREIFIDPNTNDVWKVGDRIRRLKLAETLEIIAEEGPDTMYSANGTIAKLFVKDIQELGGIITIEDLVRYEAEWKAPITTKLKGNYTVQSVSLPASGLILSLILNILNGIEPSNSVDYYHQMMESFKYAYAKRTLFGDLPFNESFISQFSDMKYADELRAKIDINRTYSDPKHYGAEYEMEEDHGTAHISVLAENGDAVSITSSINSIFGSKIRSKRTGILLNDQMDDFSSPGKSNGFNLPPSPANFIQPFKRPQSSMCPAIILDQNGDAIFVVGSAGGSKITTAVAHVFVKHFWLKETLKKAVFSKRLHHQLIPMEIQYEKGFDADILDGLRQKGHMLTDDVGVTGFAALSAISRSKGYIEAAFDPRRFGSIAID